MLKAHFVMRLISLTVGVSSLLRYVFFYNFFTFTVLFIHIFQFSDLAPPSVGMSILQQSNHL